VDAGGRIVREAKVASEPSAPVQFLEALALPLARLGLEAGPLSQWLAAGSPPPGSRVLLETRHVKAALSAMVVKTDRKDARGIARLLRMGWSRRMHCKSPAVDYHSESGRSGAAPCCATSSLGPRCGSVNPKGGGPPAGDDPPGPGAWAATSCCHSQRML
jgi:hypothetical protein